MAKATKSRKASMRRTSTSVAPLSEIEWARRWFDGAGACPVCGDDRMIVASPVSGGDTRLETWRCEKAGCGGRWQVDLRESAVGILKQERQGVDKWYERIKLQPRPEFLIEIEGGIIQGVRLLRDSAPPEKMPRFLVREYASDGSLEEGRVTGIDRAGREYYQFDLDVDTDE